MTSKTLIITMLTFILLLNVLLPVQSPAAPIQIPATFDSHTVETLIDNIEQGNNAVVLKIGYFLSHNQQSFEITNGFELLKKASSKEPVGTRRWSLFHDLIGFAVFHNSELSWDEGFESYDALFTHFLANHSNLNADVVSTAATDVSSLIAHRFKYLGLEQDERTQRLLVMAWKAYLQCFETGHHFPVDGQWSDAISAADCQEQFTQLAEAASNGSLAPRSFQILWAIATILEDVKPATSIKMLRLAKPLLPLTDTPKINKYYNLLVSLLVRSKNLDGAIIEQKDQISRTGRGNAELIDLYHKNHDDSKRESILHALSLNNADEVDINNTADMLLQISHEGSDIDSLDRTQAEALLTAYLNSQRHREIEQDLRARFLLGKMLIEDKKIDDAKKYLFIQTPSAEANPVVEMRYNAIQQLYSGISPKG